MRLARPAVSPGALQHRLAVFNVSLVIQTSRFLKHIR
jgi:hypothetical protein